MGLPGVQAILPQQAQQDLGEEDLLQLGRIQYGVPLRSRQHLTSLSPPINHKPAEVVRYLPAVARPVMPGLAKYQSAGPPDSPHIAMQILATAPYHQHPGPFPCCLLSLKTSWTR